MPTTLESILQTTREGLPALRARRRDLDREAREAAVPRSLLHLWQRNRLALIAEVKRRSPSAGTISAELDPVAHARAYQDAGASAISVLTDGPYFGGSLDDLRSVAQRVGAPVLRKDFILDALQIAEARAAGASAVLLIVRALDQGQLRDLLQTAGEYRLDALVEVHDPAELDRALAAGARLVGVNSRNLDDFRIDIAAAWRLIRGIPPDVVAIAESGMASEADVRRAADAGADGVLIGTALSSAPDPSALTRACAAVPRVGR